MSRKLSKFSPNKDKMRELILYISQSCATQHNFGKTKLVKTLYFADVFSFLRSGQPITGWAYIRMPYGPFPDDIESELEGMIRSNQLQIQAARASSWYEVQKPVNLREPNLSLFTPDEIHVVNGVIRQLEGLSGSTLSEISHVMAWKFAREGEEIPYESIHLDTRPLTDAEIIRGMEIAEEHGLVT